MGTMEEYFLLEFLMGKYYEDTSMETRFFVESLDFSVFRTSVLRQVMEKLDTEITNTTTEGATDDPKLHVKRFLASTQAVLHTLPSLQVLTRKYIRGYLLDLHPQNNLYFLIVQLPLPCNVIDYLTYGQRPPGIGHFVGFSSESVV